MTLSEKLLYLRKKHGLSQEQLAMQLTVSRQAISKWELGESLPDTDNIVQLTRIFNVTEDFLLNNELDIPIGSTTEDDKEILQSLLEKELKDDSDRLALKARNQKSESSIWIPIFTSGIMFLVIVMVYVFFFAS